MQELVDAENNGQTNFASFRKSPSGVNSSGSWYDWSMFAGNPSPQYYASTPLISVAMSQSSDGGLRHGRNVSPQSKFLRSISVTSGSVLPVMPAVICDYLLYYPFCPEDSFDVIELDNSQAITRYTDGDGVQIMLVSVSGRTGGTTMRLTYTNQDGVAGRVTQTVTMQNLALNGAIANSASTNQGFIVPLQQGDTGVRSVESYQFLTGPDIGLFTIVLIKPLATFYLREGGCPTEKDFLLESKCMPKIEDDAYLNILVLGINNLNNSTTVGTIRTVWN